MSQCATKDRLLVLSDEAHFFPLVILKLKFRSFLNGYFILLLFIHVFTQHNINYEEQKTYSYEQTKIIKAERLQPTKENTQVHCE